MTATGLKSILSKRAAARGASAIMAVALIVCCIADASAAKKRVPGQYGYSTLPYWRVGQINQRLSAACQRGEFGQRAYLRYSIGYVGNQGRAVTGIATSSWNLSDPKGLAEPRKTYHFFNQGYSNCKVFVSDMPRRRGTAR